jgi:hypothetical protein
MFGATSSWGNNQQNQAQNPTTGAFGQPSGFGAANTTNGDYIPYTSTCMARY